MPTGVHLRDARGQLFDAAERVLLRAGAPALTSRSVTEEAGLAKGVLHRHFTDFDDFLAALVRDRAAGLDVRWGRLLGDAGSGEVAGTVAAALTDLYASIAAALVPLVIFRDELRARLGGGIPILGAAVDGIAAYLTAECEMGRLAVDADPKALALALVGGGHLLSAGTTPEPEGVRALADAVLADVVTRRLL